MEQSLKGIDLTGGNEDVIEAIKQTQAVMEQDPSFFEIHQMTPEEYKLNMNQPKESDKRQWADDEEESDHGEGPSGVTIMKTAMGDIHMPNSDGEEEHIPDFKEALNRRSWRNPGMTSPSILKYPGTIYGRYARSRASNISARIQRELLGDEELEYIMAGVYLKLRDEIGGKKEQSFVTALEGKITDSTEHLDSVVAQQTFEIQNLQNQLQKINHQFEDFKTQFFQGQKVIVDSSKQISDLLNELTDRRNNDGDDMLSLRSMTSSQLRTLHNVGSSLKKVVIPPSDRVVRKPNFVIPPRE
jgi:uncharacterized coiled-coil protein SlyX